MNVKSLLNKAKLAQDVSTKLRCLNQVTEIVLENNSVLKENLGEILLFEIERFAEVREWLVEFIETVICTVAPHSAEVEVLVRLLDDTDIRVIRRVVQCATKICRTILLHLLKYTDASLFAAHNQLREAILNKCFNSPAEVVRLQTYKYCEILLLCFSEPAAGAILKRADTFHLGLLPAEHAHLKLNQLEEEAVALSHQLLQRLHTQLTSGSAIVLIRTFLNVIRQRTPRLPLLMPGLIDFGHSPPASLSVPQVNSLKHILRTSLIAVLKMRVPEVLEMSDTIISCLTDDLDISPDQVMSATRWIRAEKRRRGVQSERSAAQTSAAAASGPSYNVEQMLQALPPLHELKPETLANMVLAFMNNLPEQPSEGASAISAPVFASIDENASEMDRKAHAIQKFLAEPQFFKPQLMALPLGPEQCARLSEQAFVRIVKSEAAIAKSGQSNLRIALLVRFASGAPLQSFIANTLLDHICENFAERQNLCLCWLTNEWLCAEEARDNPLQSGSDAVKMDVDEEPPQQPPVSPQKEKAASYEQRMERYEALLSVVLERVCENISDKDSSIASFLVSLPMLSDGALAVVERFCAQPSSVLLGLQILRDLTLLRPLDSDRCLRSLLSFAVSTDEAIRSPAIRLVANKMLPLAFLKDSIVQYANNALLEVTGEPPQLDEDAMREAAYKKLEIVALKEKQEIATAKAMVAAAAESAKKAEEENPGTGAEAAFAAAAATANAALAGERQSVELDENEAAEVRAKAEQDVAQQVKHSNEEWYKSRITLHFALCTKQQDLLHAIIKTYVAGSQEVRRVIHRQIVGLVRTIGRNTDDRESPLLRVIEQCEEGAETLILQILHTLTESTRPTSAIVDIVNNLFQRLQDARFLIPIFGGISKSRALSLLPDIVSLPPKTVRSAIQRLSKQGAPTFSPLSPADVLFGLHMINLRRNVELTKKVMAAIQICFDLPKIFTQDVLAVALQRLVTESGIPTLFMRTVLLARSQFPRLMNFILTNILPSLVRKRVWEDKGAWQGFLLCCKDMLPNSCQVLAQLPPVQLEKVVETAPKLYVRHFRRFMNSSEGRKAVSRAIANVIRDAERQRPRR